jgi:hypothetical protein
MEEHGIIIEGDALELGAAKEHGVYKVGTTVEAGAVEHGVAWKNQAAHVHSPAINDDFRLWFGIKV